MASVTINYMREKVADLYEHPGWKNRVNKYMSDRQIIAIYHNALEHNRFDKKTRDQGQYHQMTLAEYMANK